ncbi:hypothetical protein A6R68_05028 [Neotoma lepida]|uniref:Uncharacterized protein n=1 Tax=Neotoma lepida TaxID=56216 RepID=A0A1A6GL43_NEOLE|nr:hypothetical protein A6R68_05028 [Neotoma lepida]
MAIKAGNFYVPAELNLAFVIRIQVGNRFKEGNNFLKLSMKLVSSPRGGMKKKTTHLWKINSPLSQLPHRSPPVPNKDVPVASPCIFIEPSAKLTINS